MNIEIITPATEPSALNECLRSLVRAIHKARPQTRGMGGLLGGPDGYGVEIETAAFVMHCHNEDPPCRCGADDTDLDAWEAWVAGGEVGDPPPPPTHALTCPTGWPNFLHKRSGFAVWWHKWIGRSMETQGTAPDLSAMLAECVASLVPR